MTSSAIRIWSWLHKWSSLVCTVFMLMLCLTGLPLLFHHEIDHWLGNEVEAPPMSIESPRANLDDVLAAATTLHQGKKIQFIFREPGDNDRWFVTLGDSVVSQENIQNVVVDARTAQVLGQPKTEEGFLYIVRKLHLDMFAGLPGTLFLGFIGILFSVAIISGVVLYAPFMRKIPYGVVRKNRSSRIKWLDTHNLVGVVTLVWAFVVGLTGVVNTLTLPALGYWQANDLPQFIGQYKHGVALTSLGSLHQAVKAAEKHQPDMTVSFVSFPGGIVSTPYHYAIFMKGHSPLTARLLKPVLVDAQTSEVTASVELPWYLKVLLISQPLHFGDYGGLPLRIIWALLDIATILVLGTGLYLWLKKSPAASVNTKSERE